MTTMQLSPEKAASLSVASLLAKILDSKLTSEEHRVRLTEEVLAASDSPIFRDEDFVKILLEHFEQDEDHANCSINSIYQGWTEAQEKAAESSSTDDDMPPLISSDCEEVDPRPTLVMFDSKQALRAEVAEEIEKIIQAENQKIIANFMAKHPQAPWTKNYLKNEEDSDHSLGSGDTNSTTSSSSSSSDSSSSSNDSSSSSSDSSSSSSDSSSSSSSTSGSTDSSASDSDSYEESEYDSYYEEEYSEESEYDSYSEEEDYSSEEEESEEESGFLDQEITAEEFEDQLDYVVSTNFSLETCLHLIRGLSNLNLEQNPLFTASGKIQPESNSSIFFSKIIDDDLVELILEIPNQTYYDQLITWILRANLFSVNFKICNYLLQVRPDVVYQVLNRVIKGEVKLNDTFTEELSVLRATSFLSTYSHLIQPHVNLYMTYLKYKNGAKRLPAKIYHALHALIEQAYKTHSAHRWLIRYSRLDPAMVAQRILQQILQGDFQEISFNYVAEFMDDYRDLLTK